MTCIVGMTEHGIVYLGGDAAAVAGDYTQPSADPKVFAVGPYVIGYTTSFRMGQLLQYAFTPPDPATEDLHAYMCTTFIDAVRSTLKAAGWAKKEDDREEGGTFLAGVRGHLFEIQDDYQVTQMADHYTAVGCGAQTALGVMYATKDTDMAPAGRLRCALNAAAHFSTGVRPPFTIVSTRDSLNENHPHR